MLVLAAAAPAWAQFGGTTARPDAKVVLAPPVPQAGRTADAGSPWGMIVGVFFALLVLSVALFPVKRGHQD